MTQEKFKASTHYNDWTGTVAADDTDAGTAFRANSFSHHLHDEGLLQDGEYLIAMKVIANIPSGKFKDLTVYLHAATGKGKEDARLESAVRVRTFQIDMSPQDFFDRFKQFQLTLSTKGTLENDQIWG